MRRYTYYSFHTIFMSINFLLAIRYNTSHMDTDILKDEPSAEYSNSIPPVLPAGDVAKSTLFANQISHIEENAQLASPTSSRATPPSKCK